MLRRKFGRPSHATVVAYLALFVALGGTGAYAANTIRSSDIVDGEVTSADVANQNLTGGDIKDNSISSFDIASLVGDDVIDGTLDDRDIGKTASTDPSQPKSTPPAAAPMRNAAMIPANQGPMSASDPEVLRSCLRAGRPASTRT